MYYFPCIKIQIILSNGSCNSIVSAVFLQFKNTTVTVSRKTATPNNWKLYIIAILQFNAIFVQFITNQKHCVMVLVTEKNATMQSSSLWRFCKARATCGNFISRFQVRTVNCDFVADRKMQSFIFWICIISRFLVFHQK